MSEMQSQSSRDQVVSISSPVLRHSILIARKVHKSNTMQAWGWSNRHPVLDKLIFALLQHGILSNQLEIVTFDQEDGIVAEERKQFDRTS